MNLPQTSYIIDINERTTDRRFLNSESTLKLVMIIHRTETAIVRVLADGFRFNLILFKNRLRLCGHSHTRNSFTIRKLAISQKIFP